MIRNIGRSCAKKPKHTEQNFSVNSCIPSGNFTVYYLKKITWDERSSLLTHDY